MIYFSQAFHGNHDTTSKQPRNFTGNLIAPLRRTVASVYKFVNVAREEGERKGEGGGERNDPVIKIRIVKAGRKVGSVLRRVKRWLPRLPASQMGRRV